MLEMPQFRLLQWRNVPPDRPIEVGTALLWPHARRLVLVRVTKVRETITGERMVSIEPMPTMAEAAGWTGQRHLESVVRHVAGCADEGKDITWLEDGHARS